MSSFQDPFKTHFRNEITVIANLVQHPQTPKPGPPEEKATATEFDSREGKAIMMAGITDMLPFAPSTWIGTMKMGCGRIGPRCFPC